MAALSIHNRIIRFVVGAALLACVCFCATPAHAAVDEQGNIVMKELDSKIWMPDHLKPTPEQEEEMIRNPKFDTNKEEDQQKLHRLLMYELGRYNEATVDKFLNFYEYEDFYELDCPHRMMML